MGIKVRGTLSAGTARKKALAERREKKFELSRSELQTAFARAFGGEPRPHQIVVLEYRAFDADSSDIGVYTYETYIPCSPPPRSKGQMRGPVKPSGGGEIIMVADISVEVGPRQIARYACALAASICASYPNDKSWTRPFFALTRDHDGMDLNLMMFNDFGDPIYDWWNTLYKW